MTDCVALTAYWLSAGIVVYILYSAWMMKKSRKPGREWLVIITLAWPFLVLKVLILGFAWVCDYLFDSFIDAFDTLF